MEVFKSRRFWSALVGIIFMVLSSFVPELRANQETLITAIMVVVGLLIGGYSVEDAIAARKQ